MAMKKILLIGLIISIMAMLGAAGGIAVYAEETKENKMEVTVRIEGTVGNVFFKTLEIPYGDKLTVQDALKYVDDQEDSLTITGTDTAYITDINGEAAGKFGGWDGWLYLVNGEDKAVGIDACTLKDKDEVVLYYGDPFGVGMQFPQTDISKIKDGIIKFTSKDTTYDENFNPTVTENPVKGAKVIWHYDSKTAEYTTDDNGEIKIVKEHLTAGDHIMQIEKFDESGLSLALRFAPDYSVNVPAEELRTIAKTDSVKNDYNTLTGDTSIDSMAIVVLFMGMALVLLKRKDVTQR